MIDAVLGVMQGWFSFRRPKKVVMPPVTTAPTGVAAMNPEIPFQDLFLTTERFIQRMTYGTLLCVVSRRENLSYEVWWNKPHNQSELVATLRFVIKSGQSAVELELKEDREWRRSYYSQDDLILMGRVLRRHLTLSHFMQEKEPDLGPEHASTMYHGQ